MSTEYHAEHVGSLLRPPWLLDARAALTSAKLVRKSAAGVDGFDGLAEFAG
jgi:methionine synthase II (cobalamin-independent)